MNDLEENRKLQKEMIRSLQIFVETLKKDKDSLAEELKSKDETIHKMRSNQNMCTNG